MKTRCPDCQTVFRVTPEQLRARAGKVRCGHCQAVFNALDSLLEERHPATEPPPAEEHPAPVPAIAWSEPEPFETAPETPPSLPAGEPEIWEPAPGTPAASDEPSSPDEPSGPDKSTGPDEPPETPVALAHRLGWPGEKRLWTTIAELAATVRAEGIDRQTVFLVLPGQGSPKASKLYDPDFSHGCRPARNSDT